MRIALINKAFSGRSGGAERYALDLAHALIEAGHSVHLAGWIIDDPPAGASIERLADPRSSSGAAILQFDRLATAAIRRADFDVVYCLTQTTAGDCYFAGGGLHSHWLSIRYPNPWLRRLAVAVNSAHRAQLRLESRIAADPGIRIIVNSNRVADHFRAGFPAVSPRLSLVRHAVDHRRFNPQSIAALRPDARRELGLDDRQLLIVFPSHNWRRKGLATLIRSIAASSALGRSQIAAVGRGRSAEYSRLARKLGVKERVRFLPPTEQIEKFYAAADIVALPTRDDPCAVACLEAMACGLPVVTSAANGAGELIEHRRSGCILQRAEDSLELSGSLEELNDAQTRHRIGQAASQAMQPWTWPRHVADLLAAFTASRR